MAGGFLAFRCGNYERTAEREQFRLLCNKMKLKFAKSDSFCLMIGNYNIFDCEFDAIVIKQDAIIAVEFKNYGGNIIACENGDWTSNDCPIKGGSHKTVYQQARVNHAALRKGLRDLGINQSWLKDIPTIVVFNHTASIDNQLSGKVRSWLHVTDNDCFIDKLEDITCPATNISNTDVINLAIRLNLNTFLIEELSCYDYANEKETSEPDSQIDLKYIVNTYDRFTPNHIYSLRPNQVFVFGTDRKGSQKFGAAGLAARKFGAQIGVIDGPTGNCYALPTKGFSISDLNKAVARFKDYVDANRHLTFLVTPIGCGHAGFEVKQVADMFRVFIRLGNVMLPAAFIKEYCEEFNNDIKEQDSPIVKTQLEKVEMRSDSQDDTLSSYDKRLHELIRYLLENNIAFNQDGSFVISDESGTVIAEADLGIETEKIVFCPFNSQSERAFKNNGFTIWTPSDYLQSKAK